MENKLETAPIFFVSTHGEYDVNKEPKRFVVPPNTYIFETASITEATMTPIDNPLWILMAGVNRSFFMKTFRNETPNTKDHIPYRNVFKTMHFYEPGDLIYVRELSLSGGKLERSAFPTFGFYTFPIDSVSEPFPEGGKLCRPKATIRPLEPLRNMMINSSLHYEGANMPDQKKITNKQFIQKYIWRMYPESKQGAIFIFSSCGTVQFEGRTKDNFSLADRYIHQIEMHQYQQDLKATSKGFLSPFKTGFEQSIALPPSRNMPEREGKIIQMFVPGTKRQTKNNSAFVQFESSKHEQTEQMDIEPTVPPNTFLLYTIRFPPGTPIPNTIGPKDTPTSIQSIHKADGSPYFTEDDIAHIVVEPNSILYRFVKDRLERLQGGKRKGTRRNRK